MSSIKALQGTRTSHRYAVMFDKIPLWIKDKITNDNLPDSKLWRVNNSLYDLTPYLKKHPGGVHWLETTQGMDVTDFYESFHLDQSKTSKILEKYKVSEITTERCTMYKFEPNGFYKTLQRRVLRTLGSDYKKTHFPQHCLHWFITIACVLCFIIGIKVKSVPIVIFGGLLLAAAMGTSHSLLHRKNSLSQYVFDLSGFSMTGWRVSHSISHHTYPNTAWDIEMAPFPMLELLNDKQSFKSAKITFLVYHVLILVGLPVQALIPIIANPFISTATFFKIFEFGYCYLACGSLKSALYWYLLFHISASYTFLLQSMNAAHHHSSMFHDNSSDEKVREQFKKKVDFGWFQLQATKDRKETVKKWWLSPLVFGDHQLHHLFPTIDAGWLPRLYPVFEKTCREFGYEDSILMFSVAEMAGKNGILRQLQKTS